VVQLRKPRRLAFWCIAGTVAIVLGISGSHFAFRSIAPNKLDAREQGEGETRNANEPESAAPEPLHVDVIHPTKGGMERTTTQPGTLQAFESVQLYAAVSGYLLKQTVDIGDQVKRDQLLIKVDVPELEKQILRYKAEIEQARSRVSQMEARILTAEAEKKASEAAVVQADATAKSTAATLRFRQQQLKRMKDLFALQSIEERLVDEKTEQRDAALEAHNAAVAATLTSRANVAAVEAKVAQAKADVKEALAEIQVAQAQFEKTQVLLTYSEIRAPFDGIITQRSLFVHDFVRAATESGNRTPLLTVQRTDLFRVVVQVPDRDVPFCDPGDQATVEIDALPGQQFPGKIARIASSEDPDTRLMRVEIDLPNPKGQIRNGMYGRVTIILDKGANQLSIPSSCLVGRSQDGKAHVYVIKGSHARLTSIEVGQDNGLRVAVLRGLQPGDQVIASPGSDVADRVSVIAVPVADNTVPRGH
jgi:RND family efflux transporter MFP subunit